MGVLTLDFLTEPNPSPWWLPLLTLSVNKLRFRESTPSVYLTLHTAFHPFNHYIHVATVRSPDDHKITRPARSELWLGTLFTAHAMPTVGRVHWDTILLLH